MDMTWFTTLICSANILPTKLNLSRCVPNIDVNCPLCNFEPKYSLHLFDRCQVAQILWFGCGWLLRMLNIPVSDSYQSSTLDKGPLIWYLKGWEVPLVSHYHASHASKLSFNTLWATAIPARQFFLKLGLTHANGWDRDAQNVEFIVKCTPP